MSLEHVRNDKARDDCSPRALICTRIYFGGVVDADPFTDAPELEADPFTEPLALEPLTDPPPLADPPSVPIGVAFPLFAGAALPLLEGVVDALSAFDGPLKDAF